MKKKIQVKEQRSEVLSSEGQVGLDRPSRRSVGGLFKLSASSHVSNNKV